MIYDLQDEEQLLLTFFKKYSRLEYALKVGGYGKGKEGEEVRADWPSYFQDMKDKFDKNASRELLDACNYLLEDPPKIPIRVSNGFDWVPPQVEEKTEVLFSMIKRVRDNVFHGVKHYRKYDIEPPIDPNRNKLLLRSCLVIIDELIQLSANKVREAFKDAVVQL